jgi:hypothetical protein
LPPTEKHRRRLGAGALLVTLAALWAAATPASAAPPSLGEAWASQVATSSARLQAEVNPNSKAATYHFDYITAAAYEANLKAAKDPFTATLRSPAGSDASAGSGGATVTVTQLLFNLQVGTAYRYRIVAKNADGTSTGEALTFTTQAIATGALLPDGRGWEMVSPVDKNGGQVDPPGALASGGMLRAAAQGGAITYGSAASFAGGSGAPPASQYLATRTAGGWSTLNITAPLFSGSYDTDEGGVPYRLFSSDLARALLLNGRHCRGEAVGCAVANPPLAGTEAPAGYQNYYLRTGPGYEALLGPSEVAELEVGPAEFELTLAGASPDLHHVVLSTCGSLTADASEGCGTDQANLYLWSAAGLSLLNGAPGAELAAPAGAVSEDGTRVYWTDVATANLYLREGAQTKQADQDAGGGGSFAAAANDGSIAYFTKSAHLWRYVAAADAATDLTPSGGVTGVLGASADGTAVYYQDAGGLRRWAGGVSTVAPGADAADTSNFPPATGTARVSADGQELLFLSTEPLTGYDSTDLASKAPDSQVFLYEAGEDALACLSCNPTNGRPIGPSSVPGALLNGKGAAATIAHKPRALSGDGRRVFFESGDALVATDTNNDTDVYQWEAQGKGSCAKPGGCLALISSGRAASGDAFIDASADGAEAFFLTDRSLIEADPGSIDLYVARIGGGFPLAPVPIPCQGDACQVLPPEPIDPTLTTVLSGPGNPKVRFKTYGQHKCQGKAKKGKGGKGAKCASKGKGKQGKAKQGGGRR